MKRLLLIVLPLLLIVGCSQKPVDKTTLIEKDGVMYLPNSDKPYTGEVFTNYSTGEKEYQGTYENGLLVTYSYLNKDGSVKEPINYETTLVERDGVFYTKDTNKPYTGKVFSLYNDGTKKEEGKYRNGLKDGKWTSWHENGQKRKEGTYKDGKMIKKKVWNNANSEHPTDVDDVNVYEKTYKDGKLDRYTEWYGNGQKKKEGTYKGGETISEKQWNEDGSVKE